MKLEIFDREGMLSDSALSIAEAKLVAAMSKFGYRVQRAVLTVSDVGGSRGGQEKECRLMVKLAKASPVVTTIRDETLSRAISRAIRGSERSISRRINRRSTTVRPVSMPAREPALV